MELGSLISKSVPVLSRKWDRRCFRLDSGLQLKHWMPVEEKEDIYRYCLYNRPIEEIPAYTNEEYEAFLKDEQWSRVETDYLIELAKDYSCNFLVMHDRYQFGGTEKKRSVEEIKSRYNDICKKLPSYSTLYDAQYDPQRELARKAWIEKIYSREAQYLKEEKFITDQVTELVDSMDDFVKERQSLISYYAGDLFAFIDGITQAEHAAPATMVTLPTAIVAKKGSIGTKGPAMSLPLGNGPFGGSRGASGNNSNSGGHPLASGFSRSMRTPARDAPAPHPLSSSLSLPGSTPGPKKEKTVIGPHVRSTRLKPVRTGLTKHVERVMLDFGLPPRPTIPTAQICSMYDDIRSLVMALIEVRKAKDRAAHEYKQSSSLAVSPLASSSTFGSPHKKSQSAASTPLSKSAQSSFDSVAEVTTSFDLKLPQGLKASSPISSPHSRASSPRPSSPSYSRKRANDPEKEKERDKKALK